MGEPMSGCKHRGLAELLACSHCNRATAQQSAQLQALGWQVVSKQSPEKHTGDCGLDTNHEGPCGPIPPVVPAGRREQRIAFLERKRAAIKTDLQLKFEDQDWHGVADAAMDLRDVDCELAGLRY